MNEEPKFTPGPWLLDGSTFVYALESAGYRFGKETFRNRFDINVQGPVSLEEKAATAKLIQAAPDIFYALEKLVEVAEFDKKVQGPRRMVEPILESAKAALAKALGKEGV